MYICFCMGSHAAPDSLLPAQRDIALYIHSSQVRTIRGYIHTTLCTLTAQVGMYAVCFASLRICLLYTYLVE